MGRKATRNRSQPLSLRINPMVRFGLECVANDSKTSMTQVIERALIHAMGDLKFACPKYLNMKYEVDGKVRLIDIVPLMWDEDEAVRLLRIGVLAPSFLSGREQLAYKFFSGEGGYEFRGESISFRGDFDVFKDEASSMSEEYRKSGPRFDLPKCQEYLERVKGVFDSYFDLDTNKLAEFVSNK